MAIKIKKDALTDAANAALAASKLQSSSTAIAPKPLSAKEFGLAPFDNSTLNLKGPNGVLLPPSISVNQAESVLSNKYNVGAVDSLKTSLAANYPSALKNAGVTSLSPTGQVTPKEIGAILSVLQQGYANNPTSTFLNFNNILNDLKTGAYAGQNITSAISNKSFDQPNIQASKATINSIFSDMLGRTATETEINKYTNQYLDYAAKNPTSNTSGQYSYGYIPTPSGSQRLQKQSQQETSVQNQLNEKEFITNQVMAGTDYNTFAAANTAHDFLTNLAKQSVGGE